MWTLRHLAVLLALVAYTRADFIKLEPNARYVYKFVANSETEDAGALNYNMRIGYSLVNDTNNLDQEVKLDILHMHVALHDGTVAPNQLQTGRWFSFYLNPQGKIRGVRYPENEDPGIVAMKKGLAAALSGSFKRFAKEHSTGKEETYKYRVTEVGHEGNHNATYHVVTSPSNGTTFRKIRHEHPEVVDNAASEKTVHFMPYMSMPHAMDVNEEFDSLHKAKPGFDPRKGEIPTRVREDTPGTDVELPRKKTIGRGRMEFLYKDPTVVPVPTDDLIHDSVEVSNPTIVHYITVKDAEQYITGNLTCMRSLKRKTTAHSKCFLKLSQTLKQVKPDKLEQVVKPYLVQDKIRNRNELEDMKGFMDALGTLKTHLSQDLFVKYVMESPLVKQATMSRIFVYFVGLERPPSKRLVNFLERLSFRPESFSIELDNLEVISSARLCLGSVVHTLYRFGDMEQRKEAHRIMDAFEELLGIHDPYVSRTKRDTLDNWDWKTHVMTGSHLISAIGNGGMPRSFGKLQTFMNQTDVPQNMRRAAIYAMRKHPTPEAAKQLLEIGFFDPEDQVRLDAIGMYERHEHGGNFTRMAISLKDAYKTGRAQQVLHEMKKRSILGDFATAAQAVLEKTLFSFDIVVQPNLNWVKWLGNEKVGASFTLIVDNRFYATIKVLSGKAGVHVHDEAAARIHLGILGLVLELLVLRFCFRGDGSYDLNILTEFSPDKLLKKFKEWDGIFDRVLEKIEKGVDLFNKFIDEASNFNVRAFGAAFIDALEQLPDIVMDFVKKGLEDLKKIMDIDASYLPPPIRPLFTWIVETYSLYSEIRTAVMNLYNNVNLAITNIIPKAVETFISSIVAIGGHVATLFDSPTETISGIASEVMKIGAVVLQIIEVKDNIIGFFRPRPSWFDLRATIKERVDTFKSAIKSFTSGVGPWINQVATAKDPIKELTSGKMSGAEMKSFALDQIQSAAESLKTRFEPLTSFAQPFVDIVTDFIELITSIKEDVESLKKAKDFVMNMVMKIFGKKFHKNFPKVIREIDTHCSANGSYPATSADQYETAGVDVKASVGQNVVSPFACNWYKLAKEAGHSHDRMVCQTRSSPRNVRVILYNVVPLANMTNLKFEPKTAREFRTTNKPIQVFAGGTIGKVVAPRRCLPHIHIVMTKTSTVRMKFIDPTPYIPERLLPLPTWDQICDDYRVVFKFEVLKEGSLLGRDAKKKGTKKKKPGRKSKSSKGNKLKSTPKPKTTTGSKTNPKNKATQEKFKNKDNNSTKPKEQAGKFFSFPEKGNSSSSSLQSIGELLKQFIPRNLKLGQIYGFLDVAGLENSKTEFAEVVKLIKVLMDNKPCYNVDTMTDAQLDEALMAAGKSTAGTREEKAVRLKTAKTTCPLAKLSLPKFIVATWDDYCLGVELCVDIKIGIFRKIFKAYARLDPCTFTFSCGFSTPGLDPFDLEFKLFDITYGKENMIETPLAVDIAGVTWKVFVAYTIRKTDTAVLGSLRAGFCESAEDCPNMITLLTDTVLPLPVCGDDGSVTWPKINFKEAFSAKNIANKLKESAIQAAKDLLIIGAKKVLELLGLPADLLDSSAPCNRVEFESKSNLVETIEGAYDAWKSPNEELDKVLEKFGTLEETPREDLEKLVMHKNRWCSLFELPPLPTAVSKYVNMVLGDNCFSISACLQLNVSGFVKAIHAYVGFDPCKFEFRASIYTFEYRYVLIGVSEWGKEHTIPMGNFVIRFKIGKNDDDDFLLTVGFSLAAGGETFLDATIMENQLVPNVLCSGMDFSRELPGGSVTDFLTQAAKNAGEALAGAALDTALEMLFQNLGIPNLITDGECNVPTETACTVIQDKLPTFPDYFQVMMVDSCLGFKACLELDFKIAKKIVDAAVEFDTCNFKFTMKVGEWEYTVAFLDDFWGQPQSQTIGKAITLNYKVSIQDKDFVVDFGIVFCLDAESGDCLDEIKVLEGEVIPIPFCSERAFQLPEGVSLKDWAIGKAKDIGATALKQTTLAGLTKLGVDQYISLDEPCVRPESTVNGWDIGECPVQKLQNMFRLPSGIFCSVDCGSTVGASCCVGFDILGLMTVAVHASATFDSCTKIFRAEVGSWVFTAELGIDFEFDVASSKSVGIANAILIDYVVRIEESEYLGDRYFITLSLKGFFGFDTTQPPDLEYHILNDVGVSPLNCEKKRSIPNHEARKKRAAPVLLSQDNSIYPSVGHIYEDRVAAAHLDTSLSFLKPSCLQKPRGDNTCHHMANTIDSRFCAVTNECAHVHCCFPIDFDLIEQRMFTADILFDRKKNSFTLSLENWQVSISMNGFSNWGDVLTHEISKNVKIQYVFHKMTSMDNAVYSVWFTVVFSHMMEMPLTLSNFATFARDPVHLRAKRSMVDHVMKDIPRHRRRRSAIGLSDHCTIGCLKATADLDFSTYEEQMDYVYQCQMNESNSDCDEFRKNEEAANGPVGESRTGSLRTSPMNNLGATDKWGKKFPNANGAGNKFLDVTDSKPATFAGSVKVIGGGAFGGLTERGIAVLGDIMGNMTIGDLQGALDLNNIDPLVTYKLLFKLKDLLLAMMDEVIDSVLNGGLADAMEDVEILLEGTFGVEKEVEFFKKEKVFLFLYVIVVRFEFGAGGYFGVDITLQLRIIKMVATAIARPYVGILVWGELGIGILLFTVNLRLEGRIAELAFPVTATIGFSKFPFDVGLKMDLELIPIQLTLFLLILLTIPLGFVKIKITLLEIELWHYTAPKIVKNIFDVVIYEKDKSPPKLVDSESDSTNPEISSSCIVSQLADRDYTEPEWEVKIAASDDKSEVRGFVRAGTSPGGSDAMAEKEFGIPETRDETILARGVPNYITVAARNDGGGESLATCSIPTFDITLPAGRLDVEFRTTSHPNILRAFGIVIEDSEVTSIEMGVGYGPYVYGEQILAFNDVKEQMDAATGTNENHERDMVHYSHRARGKLIDKYSKVTYQTESIDQCARHCTGKPMTKCVGFNFCVRNCLGKCEIMENIRGSHGTADFFEDPDWVHYERLGAGESALFHFSDLQMEHGELHVYNFRVTNVLNYVNYIHSQTVLTDFTTPQPGHINVTFEELVHEPCHEYTHDKWQYQCNEQTPIKNHLKIIDGENSMTVFNGLPALIDLMYTRSNNYFSSNWDGIHDHETGILGYNWAVGHTICGDEIHEHHDPHGHIFDESGWTHTGTIFPIPDPFGPIVDDGIYYTVFRAINKVAFGGPLSMTICHSTPYIIDNTKPIIHEITNVDYDVESFNITAWLNATDPESRIKDGFMGLGKTPRDVSFLPWSRLNDTVGDVSMIFQVQDGVPAWPRFMFENNVLLRISAASDKAILTDSSPPEAGQVYDSDVHEVGLDFLGVDNRICFNWDNFFDPQSGISGYALALSTSPGAHDVLELTRIPRASHGHCIEDQVLQHGVTYFGTVMAFNGALNEKNVSAESDGVFVDLTLPISGEVIDGHQFHPGTGEPQDIVFTSVQATYAAQWWDWSDPESNITNYYLTVERKSNKEGSQLEVVHSEEDVGRATSVTMHHFHHQHGDFIRGFLKAKNGANNNMTKATNGFIVDLTPPEMLRLNEGSWDEDIDYITGEKRIRCYFEFADEESGFVDWYHQVWKLQDGNKIRVDPDPSDEATWLGETWGINEKKLEKKSVTYMPKPESEGAIINFKFMAQNGAGLRAPYDSDGVLIDSTPPTIHYVRVGVTGDHLEEVVGGFTFNSKQDSIEGTWFGTDYESQIRTYFVALGSSSDENDNDIMDWTDVGFTEDTVFNGLAFSLTDLASSLPVYYMKVKCQNGASMNSSVIVSTPIKVVEADSKGYVFDGPAINAIDQKWQNDLTTITVHYTGFTSHHHGINGYVWGIGTLPGYEDVRPFTKNGLVPAKNADAPGGGQPHAGEAQATLALKCGKTYYVTIRAETGFKNTLSSITNGVKVDCHRPEIKLRSWQTPDVESGAEPKAAYQMIKSSLIAAFNFKDEDSKVKSVRYMMGSAPRQDDIIPRQEVKDLTQGEFTVSPGAFEMLDEGRPNIFTIEVDDEVGYDKIEYSPSITIDITAPDAGKMICPKFLKAGDNLECSWTSFHDKESVLTSFSIKAGSDEDTDNFMKAVELEATTRSYIIKDLAMTDGMEIFVTVTATNAVGLTAAVYSDKIVVDMSPPTPGTVIELSGVNTFTGQDATPAACTGAACGDATCQITVSEVHFSWTGFSDAQTSVSKYEAALGSTPGGTQLLAFTEVDAAMSDHYVLTNLDLSGVKTLYVSIKGYNEAGLYSVAASNGIQISFAAGGWPLLTPISVIDGWGDRDIDTQSDLDEYAASWDLHGVGCTPSKVEWSIERADGVVASSFFEASEPNRDKYSSLNLDNGGTYVAIVRWTDVFGFTMSRRTDGVRVEQEAMIPGSVFDGTMPGMDANYQKSATEISCNWNGFGSEQTGLENEGESYNGNEGATEEDGVQVVAYYSVAVGTDTRYTETIANIHAWKNVGLVKHFTFEELALVPLEGEYFCTVQAHSTAFAPAEVSSNGIRVGYGGAVTAKDVEVNDFQPETDKIDVKWEFFESELGIKFYFIGLSTDPEAGNVDCKAVLGTDEEAIKKVEEVFDIGNGLTRIDPLYNFKTCDGLSLTHNARYYAVVIGVDEALECAVSSKSVLVDTTAPTLGKIRSGLLYDQPLAITATSDKMMAYWQGTADPESGLDRLQIALATAESCSLEHEENKTMVVDYTILPGNATEHEFVDLALEAEKPYWVLIISTNGAGEETSFMSPPVLYDTSSPTAGSVIIGSLPAQQPSHHGYTDHIQGMFLHSPDPEVQLCHPRQVDLDEVEVAISNLVWNVPHDQPWNIDYKATNVETNDDGVHLTIKRQTNVERMESGAFYLHADLSTGGIYKAKIKAAAGDFTSTAMFLWDGPAGAVGIHEDQEKQDPHPDCDCCFNGTQVNCSFCDCATGQVKSAEVQEFESNGFQIATPNLSGATDDYGDETGAMKSMVYGSAGVQITGGSNPSVNLYARYKNDLIFRRFTAHDLNFDPTADFHEYQLNYYKKTSDSSQEERGIELSIDGVAFEKLDGLTAMGDDAVLMFNVFNKHRFLEMRNNTEAAVWPEATVKDVWIPPSSDEVCRYMDPFRPANNPIVLYEMGLGHDDAGLAAANFADYVAVGSPCEPCVHPCNRWRCSESCVTDQYDRFTPTLTGLAMADGETYYIHTRATTASGSQVSSVSQGFAVDSTAPIMNSLYYYDIAREDPERPVDLQRSNDTIKVIWVVEEKESGIAEYWWAIGTMGVSQTDVMDWTSNGRNNLAEINGLDLVHNTTYCVSVKARNGAELEMVYEGNCTTTNFESPSMDDVAAAPEGTMDLPEDIEPKGAFGQDDPTKLKYAYDKSSDPTITEYYFCAGREKDVFNDDLVSCLMVGFGNESGLVEIRGDNSEIYINGKYAKSIMEHQTPVNSTIDETKTSFNLAPGATIYCWMRGCNDASTCTDTAQKAITIITDELDETVADGSAQEVGGGGGSRKKRALPAGVILRVPSGLPAGARFYTEALTEAKMMNPPRADTSDNAVRTIVHPPETKEETSRVLLGRVQDEYNFAMTISMFAEQEMPGPLLVGVPVRGSSGGEQKLLYWNVEDGWSLAESTCDSGSSFVENNILFTPVCSTRNGVSGFFRSLTQFISGVVSDSASNNAPVLTSPDETQRHLEMQENSGTITVNLVGEDPDGDDFTFAVSSYNADFAEITIDENNVLHFTPKSDAFGDESFVVTLTDQPSVAEIPAASADFTFTVHVSFNNQPPKIIITDNNHDASMNWGNTKSIIHLYVTQGSEPRVGKVFVYDQDYNDHNHKVVLQVENQDDAHMEGEKQTEETADIMGLALPLPHNQYTWFWKWIVVDTTNIGTQEFSMHAEDDRETVSESIYIYFHVVESLLQLSPDAERLVPYEVKSFCERETVHFPGNIYFYQYGHECYGMAHETMSWTNARDKCNELAGGFLTQIRSDALLNEFSYTFGSVWTGYRYSEPDGKYIWTDGEDFDKFKSGIPWHPSATQTKGCVITFENKFLDVDCDEEHAFVCVKPANMDNCKRTCSRPHSRECIAHIKNVKTQRKIKSKCRCVNFGRKKDCITDKPIFCALPGEKENKNPCKKKQSCRNSDLTTGYVRYQCYCANGGSGKKCKLKCK